MLGTCAPWMRPSLRVCERAQQLPPQIGKAKASRDRSDSIDSSSTRASDGESLSNVIIFDWDDTLLPTSEFRRGASVPAVELRQHAKLVERTLRAAKECGHVAIVTLSKNQWVTRSADKFLPGLDMPKLLSELDILVYYAFEDDKGRPIASTDYVELKRSAMAKCLAACRKQGVLEAG